MVQSLDSRDQLANAVNPADNTYVPRLMSIQSKYSAVSRNVCIFHRIIFIGCNGKVFDSIYNVNQPKFKSYYTNAEDVVDGMKKAIEANKMIEC